MKYDDSSHSSTAFSAMNEMRKNGKLCDITLDVSGTEIPAHKVVLAASSAYFNAMFTNEMLEKSSTKIQMHDIDPMALSLLIDYAYTGQISVNEDNVQTLLPVASLLQISAIRDACCTFLLRQLHPSNCLGIRNFADAHSCEQLQVTSHKYALDNFRKVSLTDEFVSLSFDELIGLVSSDQLNVGDEETVYNAVIRWVKHDVAERQDRFSTLLSYVRLPLMGRSFLINQVVTEPLICNNSEAKDLLIEAMRYHLCPEDRIDVQTPRTLPRKPDGLEPFIFAIGGGSLFSIHSECEFYNPVDNSWTCISSTIQKRSRSGITSLNRYIYAIGGYNGTKDLSSTEFYDPFTNSWTETVSMGTKRSCLGVTEVNGLIYAAGGYDGTSCLSSVERFDPLISAWFSVPSLEIKRRYCRLASMHGSLYVVGGYDGANYLASVERYDPREGKWSGVAPMINRRSSCGVVALNDKLYVVGGNDGTLCMCSVERFDPVKNGWENISSMQTRRSTHDVVQVNGLLYTLGGNDGSNSLNTVECYDPLKNKWSLMKSMILRRSSVGAAVLYCSNMNCFIQHKDICSMDSLTSMKTNIIGNDDPHGKIVDKLINCNEVLQSDSDCYSHVTV